MWGALAFEDPRSSCNAPRYPKQRILPLRLLSSIELLSDASQCFGVRLNQAWTLSIATRISKRTFFFFFLSPDAIEASLLKIRCGSFVVSREWAGAPIWTQSVKLQCRGANCETSRALAGLRELLRNRPIHLCVSRFAVAWSAEDVGNTQTRDFFSLEVPLGKDR